MPRAGLLLNDVVSLVNIIDQQSISPCLIRNDRIRGYLCKLQLVLGD